MGQPSTSDNGWGFIREDSIHRFKKIIRGDVDVKNINPNNVSLRPRQKGVDMKLGIDIATVVLKKLANKVVLISGDIVQRSRLHRFSLSSYIDIRRPINQKPHLQVGFCV